MKKKIFPILWLSNVVLLLMVIILSSVLTIYSVLSVYAILLMFLMPFLLILFQAWPNCVDEIVSVNKKDYIYTPNGGISMLMILIGLNSALSIEKMARVEMVVIMLVFVAAEITLGLVLYQSEIMSRKKYIWSQVATYVLLLIFMFCTVVMNYDWGLI